MKRPEYRIAEDAKIATDRPVDLVLGLFQSLLNDCNLHWRFYGRSETASARQS